MISQVWIGVALVAALSLGIWKTYDYGHDAGVAKERAAWQEVKAELDQKVIAAQKAARKAERDSQAAVIAATDKLDKDYADIISERDAVIAALRVRSKPRTDCASGVPAASSNTGKGDGAEGAELSLTHQRFLVDLAAEADRNTTQLSTCQAILGEWQNESED